MAAPVSAFAGGTGVLDEAQRAEVQEIVGQALGVALPMMLKFLAAAHQPGFGR